ncbi:aspartate dehydrogenase [Aspergillus ellipticus CBS 707.79]|uniref:Aspartate dehydrogenase domain-containing protein n=1 Tax=Aspergillus ellipticus CBS 707.79 TaxID=1448320 RepID=A0A319D6K2_9EURO|nr:aspartate dehydrogenase [Aspergillus ellipticus CBS 707.79]
MLSVGLLGCGEIRRSTLSTIATTPIEGISLGVICCRSTRKQAAGDLFPDATVVEHWSDYCGPALNIIIEAACQDAVTNLGPKILAAGSDLFLLSLGALADKKLHQNMLEAAEAGNSRIIIMAEALAGFDGLHSLRHAGLKSVLYRSTKPPKAWKGTLAETLIDLDGLNGSTVFYRSNAVEAALQFLRNANMAAAVALPGVGFEKTQVELVADANSCNNSGQIIATSKCATLNLELRGEGFAGNSKSSQITALRVVAALEQRVARLYFAS